MFKRVYKIIEDTLEEIEKSDDILDYNLGKNSLNINTINDEQIRIPYHILESENLINWLKYKLEK